jgi:hypothetical protein
MRLQPCNISTSRLKEFLDDSCADFCRHSIPAKSKRAAVKWRHCHVLPRTVDGCQLLTVSAPTESLHPPRTPKKRDRVVQVGRQVELSQLCSACACASNHVTVSTRAICRVYQEWNVNEFGSRDNKTCRLCLDPPSYVGHYALVPLSFLTSFNKSVNKCSDKFLAKKKNVHMKLQENLSGGTRVVPYGRTWQN